MNADNLRSSCEHMTTDAKSPVDRRLVQLFRHLGLEQVHVAARVQQTGMVSPLPVQRRLLP